MMLFLVMLFGVVDIIMGLFVCVYKKEIFNFYVVFVSVIDEFVEIYKCFFENFISVVNFNFGFLNIILSIFILKIKKEVFKYFKEVKFKKI